MGGESQRLFTSETTTSISLSIIDGQNGWIIIIYRAHDKPASGSATCLLLFWDSSSHDRALPP